MTPSQAKALLPIITAFSNGRTVQIPTVTGDWRDVLDPHFDAPLHWRIKPEAKYRPWRFEEVPVGKVIKSVDGGVRVVIARCEIGSELIYLSGQNQTVYAHSLLTIYTMDDGSPCGVLE